MAAATLALAASAAAQTPAPVTTQPLGPANPPMLIQHGKVYTVGPAGTIEDGDVLIENGKIAAVGTHLAVPRGATVIDAKNKPVTPGLMASYTQLGIEEIELVNETNDTQADQDVVSAAFDVADAINPNSTLIPIARIAGVTRSLTAPVMGPGVFYGQAAVIDLGLGPDLVDKRHAAILVTLGPVGADLSRGTRPDTWAQFREVLDDAREYWANRSDYHKPGGSRDQRSARIDLDALGPVIRGEEPLLVHAERASDIRQAMRYATANHLKIVILGAEEGWMVAKELADAHVPVIIDTQHNLPSTFSDIGATLRNAARMDAAGVTVTFMPESMDPAQYARTIAQVAGNAVSYGMPWDHALAAITKNPAEVWGIADRYGTLEPGKDADAVIWDGDPLEVTSAPTAVFIKGAHIPMVSRQTMLRDRYRHLDKKGLPFAYR
jgi:imidazolonepropionase-like amidohydrolase